MPKGDISFGISNTGWPSVSVDNRWGRFFFFGISSTILTTSQWEIWLNVGVSNICCNRIRTEHFPVEKPPNLAWCKYALWRWHPSGAPGGCLLGDFHRIYGDKKIKIRDPWVGGPCTLSKSMQPLFHEPMIFQKFTWWQECLWEPATPNVNPVNCAHSNSPP